MLFRSFHELESFFSLKGPKVWYHEFALTLRIIGEKAACYGHYVSDIMLWTLCHGHYIMNDINKLPKMKISKLQ